MSVGNNIFSVWKYLSGQTITRSNLSFDELAKLLGEDLQSSYFAYCIRAKSFEHAVKINQRLEYSLYSGWWRFWYSLTQRIY